MENGQLLGVTWRKPVSAKPHLSGWQRTPRLLTVFLAALGLLLALLSPAAAMDGALDPNFNPNLAVSKIPVLRGQADWLNSGGTAANGVSLIFGYFNQITGPNPVQGQPSLTYNFTSLAKLNDSTGLIDPNFNFPINGPDGTGVGDLRTAFLTANTNSACDIIIGGSFSLASSSGTYYNLARLKWNGSAYAVDTTFPHIFTQGGLVGAVQMQGTYQAAGSYILVGGSNLTLNPGTGRDTSKAYHLIRLYVTSGDYAYDTGYAARSAPGGIVTGIQIPNASNPDPLWGQAAFIFGTFPQSDGSVHWLEVLDSGDLTSLAASLSSTQIDGPIFNFATFSVTINSTTYYQRIIVGSFQNALAPFAGSSNISLNRVAQLKSDFTGLDDTNSFNTTISGAGGSNHAITQIFNVGGQPVLGGSFTKFNGGTGTYGHIVRLGSPGMATGNVDTSFNYNGTTPTAGADDHIFRLYQPKGTGSVQILGSFQSYNGSTRACIANLRGDNGAVNSYYGGVTPSVTGQAAVGTVYSIEEMWGNNGTNYWSYLVLGGDFTGVGGDANGGRPKFNQNLAFINKDGSLPDKSGGAVEGPVKCVRSLDDGSILVAGNFGFFQGLGCTGLAHMTADGKVDSNFRPIITGANGTVPDLHNADTDSLPGKYDIMGIFSNVYTNPSTSYPRSAFTRLNSDGSLDTTFTANINIPGGSNIYVNAGGGFPNNQYGMVGYVNYGGGNYGFGCVLNSSGALQKYILFDGEVQCGASLPDGRILLGGNFSNVKNINGSAVTIPRSYLAAMTPSFDLDSSFAGTTANGPVYALRTQGQNDNGNVLIGGNFTAYKGVGRSRVARIFPSGALDNSFNPGAGANGPVYAIHWTQDWGMYGQVTNVAVLGGAFTTYNNLSRPGIAQVFASMGGAPAGNLLLLLGN